MFVSGNARYEDLSALFVTTGMGFGHIQASLSPSRVEQSGVFQGPEFSDPVGYAVTLADRRFGTPTRDQIRDLANGIRSGSWMNLVDYGLVTLGVGLFRDYLVRGERHVMHARTVAARHRGVVHGGLPAHPGGIRRAGLVLDVLGHAEAEVFHVLHGARHVGGDLVEVIEAHDGARRVEVVAPGEALDVLDVEKVELSVEK